MFFFEFFEIIKGTSGRQLLNADNGEYPHDCWSKISFFKFLNFSFWLIAFSLTVSWDADFIFNLFTKERIELHGY